MSDMLTPMNWELAPREADDDRPPSSAFAWPTPPYAAYPASEEQRVPLACEIQGINGKLMRGRMIFFVPSEQVVHVQVPPARTTSAAALRPVPQPAPDRTAGARGRAAGQGRRRQGAKAYELLAQRPHSPFQLTWADGEEAQGETIGHVLEDFGLFLFNPLDAADRVQREFIPRSAFRSFEIGSSHRRAADRFAGRDAAAGRARRARAQPAAQPQARRHPADPARADAGGCSRALEQQSRMPMVRIGEALISLGLIDRGQLDDALEQQREDRGVPLGELLVQSGTVSRQDLQTALARKMGYPIVDVTQFPCDVAAIRRIAFALARRHNALPLMLREGRLVVALEDPGQPQIIDELEFAAQMKIVPVLAPVGTVQTTLLAAYERAGVSVSTQMNPRHAGGGRIRDRRHQQAGRVARARGRRAHPPRRGQADRAVGQLAGAPDQQHDRRGLEPGRLGHPRRELSGARQGQDPLSQGRRAAALPRAAAQLPQRPDRAHQDHVRSRHLRAAQAAGRQDQLRQVLAARTGSSCASRRSRPTAGTRTW